MKIYIIVLLFLSFLGLWLSPRNSRKNRLLFILLSFITLTIISGSRSYSVGADTSVYFNIYSNIDSINIINTRWEPGFIFLVKALNTINDDPQFFLFFCSFFNIGLYHIFVYYHSKDPLLSILLYIMLHQYFSQMNLLRQSIAAMIVMIAFHFLLKGKGYISISLIILASLFHYSSIIMVIPYLILIFRNKLSFFKKPYTKKMIIGIGLSIFAFLVFPFIKLQVSIFFPNYLHYFNSLWSDSNYFGALLNYLVYLVFFVVGCLYIDDSKKDEDANLSLTMMIFSLLFYSLSIRMEIFERVTGLFIVYNSSVWVPCFVYDIKNVNHRNIIILLILLFSFALMIVILIFRPEWSGVVPYQFAFSQ